MVGAAPATAPRACGSEVRRTRARKYARARAGARRHEHVADAPRRRSSALRARPGRGAPPPRRRRGRRVRVPSRAARARARGRARARAHARRRLRRRPRALRPHRVARARGAARAGRRDAARQRPLRRPLATASRAPRCRSARSPPPSRARSARNLPGAGDVRGASRCCPWGSRSSASGRSRAREARARLGLDPDGPYLLFPHHPARPLKRFDRAREAAGDVPLLTLGARSARGGAVLDQRGERRARALAGRGLRARRARGARLRGARARDAGRDPPARARRASRARLRAVGPGAWRRRWRRTSRPPTRGSTGARAPELFSADRMAARVVQAWRRWRRARPRARGRRRPADTGLYSDSGRARRAHSGLP